MGAHAILSPSAAYRWLNCTAAPRLEQDAPDKESEYALEGTLAHAYCAKKLKEFLGLGTAQEDDEIKTLNATYHTGEMDEYTDTYVSIVLEKYNAARAVTKDAQLLVETRLDFSQYIPDSFGTGDAVIIADGVMEIIDFKYGKGVAVSAVDNPQMKIYAVGAYLKFSFEYNIEAVRMTIIQPRIDNLSEAELSVDALFAWVDLELVPKAKQAFAGDGPTVPGKWCQFCRVKHTCKALAEQCTKTADAANGKLLTVADMEAWVLPSIPVIKTWLAGIEEYALQQALAGTSYNGYKVVEGRSVRKITEPAEVMRILKENGYPEESYTKPTELRSITDLETNIGKKAFSALCKDYINKPAGKPTLVPESDKRPVFNSAINDFNGIDL